MKCKSRELSSVALVGAKLTLLVDSRYVGDKGMYSIRIIFPDSLLAISEFRA